MCIYARIVPGVFLFADLCLLDYDPEAPLKFTKFNQSEIKIFKYKLYLIEVNQLHEFKFNIFLT